KFMLPITLIAIKHFRAARDLLIRGADRIKPPRMTDGFHTAVALRGRRSGNLFVSSRERHLLEQAQRAFRRLMSVVSMFPRRASAAARLATRYPVMTNLRIAVQLVFSHSLSEHQPAIGQDR